MATATDPNAEIAGGEHTAHDEHGHDSPFFAHHFESWNQQFEAGKLGMWAFLVQEILFFSGLFCAYAVYRLIHPEIFEYADQFLSTPHGFFNTIVLLFSSLTMAWGVRSAMLGQQKGLIICLGITLFLAALFLGVKAFEYTEKWHAQLIWGGAIYERSTGSMPALVQMPQDGVLHGEKLESGVANALFLLEVACAVAGLICVVAGVLVQKVDRGIAVVGAGALLALAVICGLADLVAGDPTLPEDAARHGGFNFPDVVVAILWGMTIGSLFCLLVASLTSKIVSTTLCAIGLMTAFGIVLGSEGSLFLHHAMHPGDHGEGHASASHEGEDHAEGEHSGDEHSDEEHGGDEAEHEAEKAEETATAEYTEPAMNEMEPRAVELSDIGTTEPTFKPGEIPEIKDRPRRLGIFFGIYYSMTGLHAIHILAGIAAISWILCRAVQGHFTPEYFGPVDFVGLYWHLVDLVWIYLFPLLYLIG